MKSYLERYIFLLLSLLVNIRNSLEKKAAAGNIFVLIVNAIKDLALTTT